MSLTVYAVLLPLLTFLLYLFVILRLSFFKGKDISGRYLFLSGGIIVFIAALWQGITTTTAYADWFLTSAYPVIELIHFILFIGGMLFTAAGLAFYADYWQSRREELEKREKNLSLLGSMQRDARQPYHLLQLLDITLKEIVSHLDESAGAIFLVNRSQRQLVLTSSAGLNKDETAALERYPMGQNLLTQTIELGDSQLGGAFTFSKSTPEGFKNRFQSSLMVPLVSLNEKTGVILLLSEKGDHFSDAEIKILAPAAEWLAERIKSTRLGKEVASLLNERTTLQEQQQSHQSRFSVAAKALSSHDAVESFCRSLVGLFDSHSVHLYGIRNNSMYFYGGSEPLMELSENYKTALLDTLDRNKPLIINQEAADSDDRSFVTRSSLIMPLSSFDRPHALLFIKNGAPIAAGENELSLVEMYTELAKLAVLREETQSLDITRKRGLEKIISLLKQELPGDFSTEPQYLADYLKPVFPKKSGSLTMVRHTDGSYRAAEPIDNVTTYDDSIILTGEDLLLEKITAESRPLFSYGRQAVGETLELFDDTNRQLLLNTFGEKGIPGFFAVCPVFGLQSLSGVILFYFYDIAESERIEWQRLLTLAVNLYSVRLAIQEIASNQKDVASTASEPDGLSADLFNQLNNHFMAIVGKAELTLTNPEITEDIASACREIVRQSETAAEMLRQKTSQNDQGISREPGAPGVDVEKSLHDQIYGVVERQKISENLYMYGGSPRHIYIKSPSGDSPVIKVLYFEALLDDALNRFCSMADDDDIITVTAYAKANDVYLDISRHHNNFPPVDAVAGFGQYYPVGEVLRHRPADRFLEHIKDEPYFYAYDRLANRPTYISFRFPLLIPVTKSGPESEFSILAIDDQPVILDLLTAMCQSSGHSVTTASSGEEGLEKARVQKFDAVLTDLAMPGMSGLEVAREIKKLYADIPIILITGWGVTIDNSQLESSGITEVLYKPFKIEQLSEIIDKIRLLAP